jgi:hypothetical protein
MWDTVLKPKYPIVDELTTYVAVRYSVGARGNPFAEFLAAGESSV